MARAGNASDDFLNVAISLGNDSLAYARGDGVTPGYGNLAINLGQGNSVQALGACNTAANLGGAQPYTNNQVLAEGVLNFAVNLGGDKNEIYAHGGTSLLTPGLNNAYSVLGKNNDVEAGPGLLAIAGSIFQTGAVVAKAGPGFNINNGLTAGGAAATPPAATRTRTAKASAAASTHRTKK